MGSFLTGNPQEQKINKKQKAEPSPANITPIATQIPATVQISEAEKEDGMSGHGLQNPGAPRPNLASSSPFRRENWANMHSLQDSRSSATDINISLPGG